MSNKEHYFTAGCTHYPTYLDRNSGACVETCPSGTFGVVTGSVDDVSTDRLRVCEPSEFECCMYHNGFIANLIM